MKAVRAALVVVILLDLALLACYGPLHATITRYDVASKQAKLRGLAVENRALLGKVAQARRPDHVAASAAALGLDLHLIESEGLVKSAGTSPAPQGPALVVPRR